MKVHCTWCTAALFVPELDGLDALTFIRTILKMRRNRVSIIELTAAYTFVYGIV